MNTDEQIKQAIIDERGRCRKAVCWMCREGLPFARSGHDHLFHVTGYMDGIETNLVLCQAVAIRAGTEGANP